MSYSVIYKAMEELVTILSTDEEYNKTQNQLIGDLTTRNVFLQDSEFRRNQWLLQAKKEAGYNGDQSFDVVWKEILEKARKYDDLCK